MVSELNVHWNNFFEWALNDSSVQTIIRLWGHVENWIIKAITKSIPFIRNKNWSSNRLFLGHNSEISFASILYFSLECSQLFHSREISLLFGSSVWWEECGRVTGIYLPCSLSARLWTGAHCLSGSAGGKVLCSKTERKHVHLDTHLFCVRASLCVRLKQRTWGQWHSLLSVVDTLTGSLDFQVMQSSLTFLWGEYSSVVLQ